MSSTRAKSMSMSRRNPISTWLCPSLEVEVIFSTPCTRPAASSTGRVMARWIASGEAPFHRVDTVRVGRSTSGMASIFSLGRA